jgi:hypothetical protein
VGYRSNVGMRGLWRFEGQMLRNWIAGLTNPRILITPKYPKCHHHRNSVGHAAFILHLELNVAPPQIDSHWPTLRPSCHLFGKRAGISSAVHSRVRPQNPHNLPPHPLNPSIFTPRDLLISSCIKLGELPLSRSIYLNHLSPQL